MSRAGRQWNDERLDRVIGNLLRAGVLLAAAVVVAGGTVYLLRHGGAAPAYHVFTPGPPAMRTVHGVVRGALAGRGRGLIQLGLLILIATPVARVAFSVIGFALERDRRYVIITLWVLGVLLVGLVGRHL